MDSPRAYYRWLVDDERWSRTALCCGIVLLGILPLLLTEANHPLVILISLLPVYMIHQFEEHGSGGFLRFFNKTIGHGFPVLASTVIFWVNVGGVWAVFAVVFYLARFVSLGFAFIAIYLVLLNAVIHVVTTTKMRVYNPGFYTAVVLFLPWGLFALIYFERLTPHWLLFNLIGVLIAIGEHAFVAAYAIRRRQLLEAGMSQQPRVQPQD